MLHSKDLVSATISPLGKMKVLSQLEISRLLDTSQKGLQRLFRNCSLAVLSTGSNLDDGKALMERYPSFDIQVVPVERGIKLKVIDAPGSAFLEGEMIRGINEHLFSVLRDIVYVADAIIDNPTFDLDTPVGITNAVFHILRNAEVLRPEQDPSLAVCWGGHSISRGEYDYAKQVGYSLGLHGLNVCTGCGPGAMKGPMKGAAVGHAKQRICRGQYLGITEPGIIAAEAPNPIVNSLVIMPDIEKRLEAFVRLAHGIVVFPGGAGTAEEILYLLGILLHPDNARMPLPLVLTGPESARDYFELVDRFITKTLGFEARNRYSVIINDPDAVARKLSKGMKEVREFRKLNHDAFHFNWFMTIAPEFQQPFEPTHENMRALELQSDLRPDVLAANLRRAFSGIVAGNVKERGIRSIEAHGRFQLEGEPALMAEVDTLLRAFVAQQRMKLPGKEYIPCYEIVSG